ncbi:beta-lactamase/transpeptidase-like protein [Penicillium cosmopolitanum]|uniref:Beta-lactamase/transpeptidase-like protein n=1 Tax=Penicillium cosmopolitanum TaxID=1131564 RepID=A0A9X0BAP3_9EURO|nr:beta-lactamase/transpeptidase-like protein [Penicillium cosmopolitanum]KAJ5397953.1 beta-lactamase/transpeptidase-like protein [Penicillium cosmopolitanum]
MPIQNSVEKVLDTISRRYRGPGGAIAVIKDGSLLGQRVWGYADLDQRVPLTPEIQMPICSITKQFVCALLLDLERNPPPEVAAKGDMQSQFTDKLHELLRPELTQGTGLTLQHLCDMQSGIRDYWAMTTLWGAHPEGKFSVENDGPAAIERTQSFHFQPGNEFSYCNVNFYITARVIEQVTGQPLGKLLAERVLSPAGMATALLCPDTAQHPGPCVGYEGTEKTGYQAAVNKMEWSGDAGLVASLTDMVAYEKYLDRIHSDPRSWYRIATEPQTFSDGASAKYHYGLGHVNVEGIDTVGHGGALRGYRLHRRHVPSEHLSVVVLFNHEADASEAVNDVIRGMLDLEKPSRMDITANPNWIGIFLDRDSEMAIAVSKGSQAGEICISYAFSPSTEVVRLLNSNEAQSNSMTARIEGDTLYVNRIGDNRKLEARRIVPRESAFEDTSLQGDYHCAEADSTFHCVGGAGLLYGSFDGYLGCGPASLMKYLGDDVWALTCQRGLDAPAPGDWTLAFHRNESGAVVNFKIGCWLARGLVFVRT